MRGRRARRRGRAQARPQRLHEGAGGGDRRGARGRGAARLRGVALRRHREHARPGPTAALLRRLVEGSREHAGRRVDEMAAAVAMLEELDVEPRVAAASEAWLRSLAGSEVGADERARPAPMRARELVRGGVDVHVHIAPDVVERRIDDVGLARRFEELGLAGFVLKSHYTSTAERAAVVRGVVPGIAALGAIVLNRAIGGMNPLAVEIAAREGARVVWMPTADSRRRARAPRRSSRRAPTCPSGRRCRRSSPSAGSRASRCRARRRTARLLPETRAGARGDRRARPRARHRPPRPRGGVRRSSTAARRGGRRARRRHAPRLPRAGLLGRRAARAGRPGRAGSSAASRRPTPASARGSSGSRARARSAPSARSCRATSAR